MTTPTQDALMALAERLAAATASYEESLVHGDGTFPAPTKQRAALASAIAEVVQEAERPKADRVIVGDYFTHDRTGTRFACSAIHTRFEGATFEVAIDAIRSAAQKTAGV